MDSIPYMKFFNEALIAEIMKESFKLQELPQYVEQLRQSPKLSSSPQESPVLSPTKLRNKGNSTQSVSETKDLSNMIIDITTQVMQFTIEEFTSDLKKERVPIQKNILKKTMQFIEKVSLQLQMPAQPLAKIQQQLIVDQSVLVFALAHISKPICDFLENNFTDYVEELQITIPEVNLLLFQPKLVQLIKEYIIQSMNLKIDSVYYTILDQSQGLLSQLAFDASEQLCLILDESRGYIENLVIKFREKVSSYSQLIMNKFVMLSLFLELSRNCYQTIQDLLEYTIFHYAEPDILDKFIKYTIENYDTLILKNRIVNTPTINTKSRKSVSAVLDLINACISNKNKPISVYKIQNRYDPTNGNSMNGEFSDEEEEYSPTKILASQMTDTKSFSTSTYSLMPKPTKIKHHVASKLHLQGLYIECEEPQFKFIVYMFRKEFIVVYAPLVSKRWTFQKTFVIDPQGKDGYFKKESIRKSGWGVYPVKYKSLKDLLESPWLIEQLAQMITWQSLSVDERYARIKSKKFEGEMDTMFGVFIAQISRANRIQSYLQAFGENAVNNGCMEQLMLYMPLLKEFLNQGGFGKQALQTHTEFYTPERRITPVSTLAISTTFVSGAIIGQVLIPIPIVGGIVGGLLGGYLGNKGISTYFKNRNLKKMGEIVRILCSLQNQQAGHWVCQKTTLDLLEINFKVINDTMPKCLKDDIEKQTKWCNLIVFGFVSLYYSQIEKVQDGDWPEPLDLIQKYLSMEKIQILETLDNLKNIIDIIIKSL